MNRKSTHGIKPPRPRPKRAGAGSPSSPARFDRSHPKATRQAKGIVKGFDGGLDIVERAAAGESSSPSGDRNKPFRVLIAVHRPRFRGRSERAAALVGWEITALLNKQDPVGICAKPPRPPDVLILSEDFGRQKDLAIFRAIQRYRQQGMRVIGLVDDCETAPDAFPASVPADLCDICLPPPYKTAEIRALLAQLYTEKRGEPAPPPIASAGVSEEDEEEI